MANLKHLLSDKTVNPAPKPPEQKIVIEGTFGCQYCPADAQYATQTDDTLHWKCPKCERISTMKSIF